MTIGIIRLGQGWRLDEDHHFDMPPQIPTQFDFRRGSPAQPNTKGQTMDYIPRTRSERYLQWKNLCDNIEAEGAKMEAADTAENAAKGAKASEAETTRQNTQAMRLAICNIKPLANPTVPEVREYISPWRHRRCRDRDRERHRQHRPRRLRRLMNEETGNARSPLFLPQQEI